jgi:hypothetical protein
MRERERESGEVVREITFEGVRDYISGFEGSQAVPVCPGIGNAYDWILLFFFLCDVGRAAL